MRNSLHESYNLAVSRFFDYSTGDPTSVLAKEHGLIGLMRIIMCMQRLGINPLNIDFIALPDFTYTRNKLRWDAGFPYGCIIRFHEKDVPFIPVDFRPNCCGVVFAEIPEFNVSALTLQKKYYDIVHAHSDIDASDLNRRNHFMGVYQCDTTKKYYFLLHGSFNFTKRALYSENNKELVHNIRSEVIMGEPFAYLIDSQAQIYYENYQKFENLTFYYRELIVKTLFPNAKIIFHRTHEGFCGIHTILLGAYANSQSFSCPIMLAPECDLPILEINKPIEIADKTALYCAPHGGGYALGEISSVQRVDNDLKGNYMLSYSNSSKMLTNNVLDMPFFYRTRTDKFWCEKYHMATELFRIKPILNLKV